MTNHDPIDIAIAAMRLYAETHPRPPHVTQAQAAEMLGLSAPTVRRLVRSGVLRLNRAGMIPIGDLDRSVRRLQSTRRKDKKWDLLLKKLNTRNCR